MNNAYRTGGVLSRPVLLACLLAGLTACSDDGGSNDIDAGNANADPVYLDTTYSPAERAVDLTARLTTEEKASQMISSQSQAIPRLRIPAYGWWNEAAHGAARQGTLDNANPPTLINTTSYPVSLSLGSTWNPELMYEEATMISSEMREVVQNNARNLNIYSPTINPARDPRWGRNDESFSEDPYLTGAMAAQFVNGLEGRDADGELLEDGNGYLKAAATIKHFIANNSEYNRLDGSSNMDERTLREYYIAPFRNVIERTDPSSIMSAYNAVNETPAAASVKLTDTLARKTYGFKGFFTSDCDAIYEIQAGHNWTPPGGDGPVDQVSRHAYANAAGEDLDCQQGYHDDYNYANAIPMALERDIQTPTGQYNENFVDVSVARLLSTRIQLGEFDGVSEVPWIKQARDALNGQTWVNDNANNAVTETEERLAMARAVADQSIVLLKNDTTTRQDDSEGKLLPLNVPESGAYEVAVVGPYANPEEMFLGGYSSIQGEAGQANEVNGYEGLQAAITARNPDATVDFVPGLSGEELDTVNADEVNTLADYDAVLVYVATDDENSREDKDRESLELPGAQADLIQQAADQNANTIVYMETVGNMNVTSFEDDVAALLWSSYNGMRKGQALADVILGDFNPSGHLPFTWYTDDGQLPEIGDYAIRPEGSNAGRTYQYFEDTPAYPFGFGLSYTEFSYSGLSASQSMDDTGNPVVEVSATVTNDGEQAGADVAQLYVASPNAGNGERPAKRLRGFERVELEAGANTTVNFTVPVRDLAFYDEDEAREIVPTGSYEFQLARSSAEDAIEDSTGVSISEAPEAVLSAATLQVQNGEGADNDIPRRILFEAGDTVVPQLTVALSDQSLYGFIHPDENQPLPDGMTVSYDSNRPGVVRVNGDTLEASGPGVATITATVEYGDRSVEDELAVGVQ